MWARFGVGFPTEQAVKRPINTCPGLAECAKRSAAHPRDGVLNSVRSRRKISRSFLYIFLLSQFLDPEPERSAYPSLILPRRPAHSARRASLVRPRRLLGALWPKKSRSKRPPKNDKLLMPFQHRFWSVLAPFLEAKMAPKSIKNRKKSMPKRSENNMFF